MIHATWRNQVIVLFWMICTLVNFFVYKFETLASLFIGFCMCYCRAIWPARKLLFFPWRREPKRLSLSPSVLLVCTNFHWCEANHSWMWQRKLLIVVTVQGQPIYHCCIRQSVYLLQDIRFNFDLRWQERGCSCMYAFSSATCVGYARTHELIQHNSCSEAGRMQDIN